MLQLSETYMMNSVSNSDPSKALSFVYTACTVKRRSSILGIVMGRQSSTASRIALVGGCVGSGVMRLSHLSEPKSLRWAIGLLRGEVRKSYRSFNSPPVIVDDAAHPVARLHGRQHQGREPYVIRTYVG